MVDQTPTPPAVPPSTGKSIWTRWWMIVIYVIVGLGFLGAILPGDGSTEAIGTTTTTDADTSTTVESASTTASPGTTAGPTTTSAPTPTLAPTTTLPPATTTTLPARVPVFGSGIQEVGVDMPGGVYETGILGDDDFFDSCYWERLSGFSGEFDEILANSNPTVHAMVEIENSDVGFDSDCGDWYNVEPIDPLLTAIPAGKWAVGVHFEAGRYEAPGGDSCYWERLSGFNGGFDNIIANDLPTGSAIVEISGSDAAFNSNGCGEWTRR